MFATSQTSTPLMVPTGLGAGRLVTHPALACDVANKDSQVLRFRGGQGLTPEA
jgi:hypothetical protein